MKKIVILFAAFVSLGATPVDYSGLSIGLSYNYLLRQRDQSQVLADLFHTDPVAAAFFAGRISVFNEYLNVIEEIATPPK